MKIHGICRTIVEELKNRTVELSQGRAAGCIGFVDENRNISSIARIVDGGVTGLPLRQILGTVAPVDGLCLLEAVKNLPSNAVFISTQPGHSGLITEIGTVDMLHIPMVNIGVKHDEICGVGISYPEQQYFDLATETEAIELETLRAKTIDEEKAIIRRSMQLNLKYLDVGHELAIIDISASRANEIADTGEKWRLPRTKIKSIDTNLAKRLVEASLKAEQGVEVATLGQVDAAGCVSGNAQIVIGGMGAVPPRLLVSSMCATDGKSLYEIWLNEIPHNAVIIHTHPGGTGVMHAGDASAGPCTWGRPIIAIGHDKNGDIQGATVIELNEALIKLGDKSEELDTAFFAAKTAQEETKIRNLMFGVSQEYTNLCKPIEIQ